jgi:nitrate/nitrite transporter NarK
MLCAGTISSIGNIGYNVVSLVGPIVAGMLLSGQVMMFILVFFFCVFFFFFSTRNEMKQTSSFHSLYNENLNPNINKRRNAK